MNLVFFVASFSFQLYQKHLNFQRFDLGHGNNLVKLHSKPDLFRMDLPTSEKYA